MAGQSSRFSYLLKLRPLLHLYQIHNLDLLIPVIDFSNTGPVLVILVIDLTNIRWRFMGERGLKYLKTYVFLLSSLHHRILLSMETVAVIKCSNQRDRCKLNISSYHYQKYRYKECTFTLIGWSFFKTSAGMEKFQKKLQNDDF